MVDETDLRAGRRTVVQHDAASQALERAVFGPASDEDEVLLFDAMAGVSESLDESAVVREEEQALAVHVEPADRHEARQRLGQKLDHSRPAALVRACADVAVGLV
jgi:hypothetical protein